MLMRTKGQDIIKKRSAEIKCDKVSNLFSVCFVEAVICQFRLVHPVFSGSCSGGTINLYVEISAYFYVVNFEKTMGYYVN